MKLLFALALTTALPAFAADYDALLDAQGTLEVTGISKPGRAYMGSSMQVCASLGYHRVVSSVTEACTRGEPLFFRTVEGATVSAIQSNHGGDVTCGMQGRFSRLVSVVCAK